MTPRPRPEGQRWTSRRSSSDSLACTTAARCRDDEFARAKDAALGRGGARSDAAPTDRDGGSLGQAANRYVTFRIGMSVVGLVVFLVVFVLVFLPRLNAFPHP